MFRFTGNICRNCCREGGIKIKFKDPKPLSIEKKKNPLTAGFFLFLVEPYFDM